MSWPTPQEYRETIQDPGYCFSDPELKTGVVAVDSLGMPQPVCGFFATVYQVECASRTWAVRCFQRELIDLQRRYEIIDRALRVANVPAMVGFEFLQQGIRVAGRWYPIVKMEWVSGQLLDEYVKANLHEADKLMSLARQWVDLLAQLQRAGIAHGDLQHGNVLIANGALKLIDYDGMFVPELASCVSREKGHRNYQHPKRDDTHFGAYLDNFSAWVIFVSLAALAIEPSLWARLKCGDERLLFELDDFKEPEKSEAFAALDRSDKPQLQGLSARLRALTYLLPNQVPCLDGAIPSHGPARGPVPAGIPTWLSDHITETPLAPLLTEPVEPAPSTVGGAGWLLEHLLDEKPLPLVLTGGARAADRWLTVLFLALTAVLAPVSTRLAGTSWMSAAVTLAGFMLLFLTVYLRYSKRPVLAEKRQASEKLHDVSKAVAKLDAAILSLHAEREHVGERLVEIDRRYRTIPQRAAVAARSLQEEFERQLEELRARRANLGTKEAEELAQADRKMQTKRAELLQRRAQLDTQENNERSALTAQAREEYIRHALAATTISAQSISGIGPKLKGTLSAYGFRTAADVTWHVRGVPGIGDGKASALMSWRASVEAAAHANFQGQIPGYAEQRLQAKYSGSRQAINRELQELSGAHPIERRSIQSNYQRYRQQISNEENEARVALPKRLEHVRAQYVAEREKLVRDFGTAKSVVESRRRGIDDQLADLTQLAFQRRVEQHTLLREVARYRAVSFSRYVAQIFGIRRAA
jgi:hypothetical protein